MKVTEYVTIPDLPATLTPEYQAMMDEFGQSYEPALLPNDIPRGPAGHCFDVCALAMMNSNGKYHYVEGIAQRVTTGEWTPHAWLTDGTHAFDPTWRAVDDKTGADEIIPTSYTGIELPRKLVLHFMVKTEYQWVLGNRHLWPEPIDLFFELKRLEAKK